MCLWKRFQKQTSHRCQQCLERLLSCSHQMSSTKGQSFQPKRSEPTINFRKWRETQPRSRHQRKWIRILQEKKPRLRRCPPQHRRSLRHPRCHQQWIKIFHRFEQELQSFTPKCYHLEKNLELRPSSLRLIPIGFSREIIRRKCFRKSCPTPRNLERKYPWSLQWFRQFKCWSCRCLQWPSWRLKEQPRQTYRLKRKNGRQTR